MPRPWQEKVSSGARRAAQAFQSGIRHLGSELRRGDWKGAGKRVGLGFLHITSRLFALMLAVCVVFILASALVGRTVQSSAIRFLVGALVALALPLAVQGQADQLLRRWAKFKIPGTAWFVTMFNVAMALTLIMTYGRELGSVVRRHGDWIYGYSMSQGAKNGRAVIHAFAVMLERFHLPPEMQPWTVEPPRGAPVYGPPNALEAPKAFPVRHAWIHPLAGERQIPWWETRRFGAIRAHHSPEECESGHCGNDLAADFGAPVFCAYDGIVERVERDARGGGLAGRYIRVGHLDGSIVTRYLHLDSIRSDLRDGDRVSAGEVIGRVGRTGVIDADTHLHFALSQRPHATAKEIYLDPEPYLSKWDLLPAPPPILPSAFTVPRVARRGRSP